MTCTSFALCVENVVGNTRRACSSARKLLVVVHQPRWVRLVGSISGFGYHDDLAVCPGDKRVTGFLHGNETSERTSAGV